MLCKADVNGAVAQLAASVAGGEPPEANAAFAAAILDHIATTRQQPAHHWYSGYPYSSGPRSISAASLAQLACCLADMAAAAQAAAAGGARSAAGDVAPAAAVRRVVELARRLLSQTLPPQLSAAQHAPAISRLAARLGAAALQPGLLQLVRACVARKGQPVAEAAALLAALAKAPRKLQGPGSAAGPAEAAACVAEMCAAAVEAVCELFEGPAEGGRATPPAEAPVLATLLTALCALGTAQQVPLVQRLLPHALAHVQPCTVPALLALQQCFRWAVAGPAAEQLVAGCRADSRQLPERACPICAGWQ